jgi:hypothetical protein
MRPYSHEVPLTSRVLAQPTTFAGPHLARPWNLACFTYGRGFRSPIFAGCAIRGP